MKEELKAKLMVLAGRNTWDLSESGVEKYAGGNINDAYNGGYNDGMTDLAKEILELCK